MEEEKKGRQIIDLEDGWKIMQLGINKLTGILVGSNEQFRSDEYMQLYTVIYNMCTQKPPQDYSQQLYDRYRETFDNYMRNEVMPLLRLKHDVFMLMEMVERWNNHKIMIRWLSRFFNYLDRYFIARRSLPTLHDVGMHSFSDLVFKDMKESLKDVVIVLINKEREGEQIDKSLLKNILGIFVEIGFDTMDIYEADFETPMLKSTSEYYSRKAALWIVEDSCPEYMVKAEEYLKREKERVNHYLHASTEHKLLDKAQEELLSKPQKQLIEKEHSGCHALLRDGKVEDLSRMCRLFSRVTKGLEPVAGFFREHVKEEGNALRKQVEDAASEKKPGSQDDTFITKVLDLHDKYMQYVTECFSNNSLFHKALKEAFEIFCNKDISGSTTAELIAAFCDNLMKKGGSEKMSDEAIEDIIEKVIKVLAYISDKDLFAEFYRKKLSRRLLNDKGGNLDHERSILSKLKQQFGGQFTSKLEGMVKDVTLAKEHQEEFRSYLEENPKAKTSTDLSVQVLTTGHWPTYKPSDLVLPAELAKCVEMFKKFYQEKTNDRRKLNWIYQLGTCHVTGYFSGKKYEFVVTTYQAAVMLLFNSSERLSYTDVKNQLNLADDDVIRQLHSLSCAKYKILKKEPDNKVVHPNDTFQFNDQFKDKMHRIRVPAPPIDEKKKVVEDVDKDRRYAIDAALVRIMKSRKALPYQQLISECVEQLSRMFKPDIKTIKKRIEDLLARDYLERDTDNPNLFKYVA